MTIADFALPSRCGATALVDRTVDPEPGTRLGRFAISNSSDGRAVAAIDQAEQHEERCRKAAA